MEFYKPCGHLHFGIVGLHVADFSDTDMLSNERQISDVFANEDACFLCYKMGIFFKD